MESIPDPFSLYKQWPAKNIMYLVPMVQKNKQTNIQDTVSPKPKIGNAWMREKQKAKVFTQQNKLESISKLLWAKHRSSSLFPSKDVL